MVIEQTFEVLAGDVESTCPGPALGALLDAVDPERLSAYDAVRYVTARRRQLAHEQARFTIAARAATEAELTLRTGSATSWAEDRFAGDELRAALVASRWKVGQWLRLADLVARHRSIEWAWLAGEIDEDRVRAFADGLVSLSGEHAAEVVRIVLPEAPALTLRALEQRIAEVAVGLDPEWAEKTYRRRCAQRRVRARRTDGGTLNLSGLDLPLDEAVLSVAHITTLAARAQALGHPGGVDAVRTDIYLALLGPDYDGRRGDEVAAGVAATARRRAADADAAASPAPTAPAESREAGAGSRPRPRGRTLPRQARIELRVGLGTLMGLDRRPARLPGYGVVHAELARDLARQHSRGEWRVAVTDERGYVVAALLPRARPVDHPTVAVTTEVRGVVEIHVHATDLDRLDPVTYPEWARVLRELHAQWRRWRERPPDDSFGADPDRRFPNAALRRWIQMRDGSCTYPTCGASARDAEIDHTRPDAHGGRTRADNLAAACTHDHDLREQPGWTVSQPRPGHVRWRSPSGHTYDRPPRPAVPEVPDPRFFAAPSSSVPSEYADDGSVWDGDPYPDPPRAGGAPAPRPPPDDPPPF